MRGLSSVTLLLAWLWRRSEGACVIARTSMDHCAWNGHADCLGKVLAYSESRAQPLGNLPSAQRQTVEGHVCQDWDLDVPRPNDRNDPGNTYWPFDDPHAEFGPTVEMEEASNICTNIDAEIGPWCFAVTGTNQWNLCFVDCDTACPGAAVPNGNLPAGTHAQGDLKGSTTSVVCDAGFGPLSGTHSYDCNAGEWLTVGTADLATVDAVCGQCPALASAAATSGTTFAYGSTPSAVPGATATITCDAGHERNDYAGTSFTLACGADGTWEDFSGLACVPTPCDEALPPGTSGQSTVTYSEAAVTSSPVNRYPGGTTVSVSCADTERRYESPVVFATCASGAWSAVVEECAMCPFAKASSDPVQVTKMISGQRPWPVRAAADEAACEAACLTHSFRDGAFCEAFAFDPSPAGRRGGTRHQRCYLHGRIDRPLRRRSDGGHVYAQKCPSDASGDMEGCEVDTAAPYAGQAGPVAAPAVSTYDKLTGGFDLHRCAQACDMDRAMPAGTPCQFIAFREVLNGGRGIGHCFLLSQADYDANAFVAEADPRKQFHVFAKTCGAMTPV